MTDDRSREERSVGEGEYEPPTVTPIGSIDQLTAGVDEVMSIGDTTTVVQ